MYPSIDERLRGLEKERARLIARLMPRAGASLARATRNRGMVDGDPTGQAAIVIAEHPAIKRLDRTISYYRRQGANMEKLLATLTAEERQVIDFYYLRELPEVLSESWPKMEPKKKKEIKRRVLERAATMWKM